ncbi:hypothetical protein KY342_05760 [Candidatus Woesearchaeota archaeon]|nr:hypothetical protein [Candidatus Woesearchaeota archaeon]
MKITKTILIAIGFILFFITALLLFEPNTDPTGFFVIYSPSMAVINNINNQPLNSNLEISFMTSGTKDLTITSLNGNFDFIELRCNNKLLNPAVQQGKIIYKDYNCKGKSLLTIKILSKELNLRFQFGDIMQQVKNTAP